MKTALIILPVILFLILGYAIGHRVSEADNIDAYFKGYDRGFEDGRMRQYGALNEWQYFVDDYGYEHWELIKPIEFGGAK